jgi:hypothetical protein
MFKGQKYVLIYVINLDHIAFFNVISKELWNWDIHAYDSTTF